MSTYVDSMVLPDDQVVTAEPPRRRWSPATRVAFRFCFVYFLSFCLSVELVTVWWGGFLTKDAGERVIGWESRQLSPIVAWVGAHVFGVRSQYHPSRGGDIMYYWVWVFCLLVLAAVATVVWSVLDRRRVRYPVLHTWFQVFLRICLASQMFYYGTIKVFPIQMRFELARMVEPWGDFSPMSVLWQQVASSRPYEMSLGAAEIVAGLLLIVPRVAPLGAVLSAVSMLQVFLLNLSFDVPVKLYALHLLLIAVVLAAPHLRRLMEVFVSDHPVERPREHALFGTGRANRIAVGAQVLLGIWILAALVDRGWTITRQEEPRSPLYGIWDVAEYSVAGQELPPLTTDTQRWRRIVFDDVPAQTSVQSMNDSLTRYRADVDQDRHTLSLTDPGSHARLCVLTYTRPRPDRLTLDGQLDGRPVHMALELLDLQKFPQLSRGFHWVQEDQYKH
ncbi:DoxX family protein [Nocardia terpenica]|uniref:DoxX family protein n=1 Tax=Nocardia terpenica TaxID=455432 RepID=UPI0018944FF3|nr:DoxX family protein [Nocardia terpenica]MBF6065971.1 DoxX family protein [Nocardia terpenica]MBF6108833.1 DoxX family protein [Nocardia terpenica]MBF6116215.1 DoxX family protein [Nocardia terpenica]MBF6123216.1 DoxX family protein [Nocardia terpenica]MBF6153102.1 DoxX family protein [Nocardia terpenica]